MKFILALMISLLSLPAFAASDCSYCAKLEKLRQEFKKVKPEPLNDKTIDRQNLLLDETTALITGVIHKNKHLSKEDMDRIILIMAVAVTYDPSNVLGEDVLTALGGQVENFFAEVTALEKTGALKAHAADELRTSVGMAEDVRQRGTDPDAPAEDEAQ